MYIVELSNQAKSDRRLVKMARLEKKAKLLLNIIAVNPFQTPPDYERLLLDMHGNFSRQLNEQHRLIYDVIKNVENLTAPDGTPYEGIIRVKRMWTQIE